MLRLGLDGVHICSGPSDDGYTLVRIARGNDELSPLAFADTRFTADEILDL